MSEYSIPHNCPVCGSKDLKVIDSRPRDNGVRTRRYKCVECDYRYNTVEVRVLDVLEDRKDPQGAAVRALASHLLQYVSRTQLVEEVLRRLQKLTEH